MARKTTIFDAVASGDPARVKRKLAREPEAIASRDEEGLTPLLRALYAGDGAIVDVLLARQPELDLFEAAALGRLDEVKRLVGRSKRRAGERSADGFTPLHLAAYYGHADVVAFLLDRGVDLEARTTNPRLPGLTPLHSAAAGGKTDVALLLLERGADPNATQPGGWTALHQAAASGNLVLCRALLRHKAKRAPLADDRTRPLDFAIENRHHEVVRLLRPGGARRAGSGR
jgi:ankyrin repeat protein